MTTSTPMPPNSFTQVTAAEMQSWLVQASRGLVENGIITSNRVAERAAILTQNINQIEFDSFRVIGLLEHERDVDNGTLIFPLVQYVFGESRQNIDHASPTDPPEKIARIRNMEGTGLNCEDLSYFARVCEIGRDFIPQFWVIDERLKKDLRAPQKHLSTLNEVWFLSLWPTLDRLRVEREKHINPASVSTVDWVFSFRNSKLFDWQSDFTVNCEVKQIFTSLESYIHGGYAAPLKDIFQGVDGKFRPSLVHEVNVVAITLFCQITPLVEEQVALRLCADPLIDAVILWSPNSPNRQFRVIFNDGNNKGWTWKKLLLNTFLKHPSIEDCGRVFFYRHPRIDLNELIHGQAADNPEG